MFLDTSHSMQFGHEFVLQQRTREIATKGFSSIAIPKPGKAPPASKVEPAITIIHEAIENQEDYLGGLAVRIHHTARLMECLNGKDDKMAISTMHKVKSIQHEYVHVLRLIAGLKAFEKQVKLGLMSHKNPEPFLKELLNVPWPNKPSTAGKPEMEAMIEEQLYFPVMSMGGKITFTDKPPVLGVSKDNGYETASTRSSSTSSSAGSGTSTTRSTRKSAVW